MAPPLPLFYIEAIFDEICVFRDGLCHRRPHRERSSAAQKSL